MNLESLIRRFRVAARDQATPYLFSDEEVTDWLNDAEREACVRGRLIRDDSTAAACTIDLSVGTHTYTLHPSVYELITVRLVFASGEPSVKLPIKSREWLDAEMPDWRDTDLQAFAVVQDDTRLRVVGVFAAGDTLSLDCYRLPLKDMANDTSKPEIHEAHHLHLIQWALYRGFSVPDVETFDQNRAALAEAEFTRYFGLRPDAGLRRETRHDQDHQNEAVIL